jgi:predicted amidohydrolase
MSPAPWRATCIQMPGRLACEAESAEAARSVIRSNLGVACELIARACLSDIPPQLVLLPEFALQGPPHGMPASRWIAQACCSLPGLISETLREQAVRFGIYIGAHQFESSADWPGRFFNTSFLIAPSGDIVLRYRRINTAAFPSPHDIMDDYVARHTPQEIFPVADTPLGRLAMIPCGEINVPEVARVLMMQGAEVILHPTNSPLRPAQEAAKIVRAAENMMAVVSANIAGGIGFSRDGSVRGGRSHILDHLGATLAFEPSDAPGTNVSAMIDIDALRRARRQDFGTMNPLLRARWEMYRPFYGTASFYPPNSFLYEPMETAADAKAALEQSVANMRRIGLLFGDD